MTGRSDITLYGTIDFTSTWDSAQNLGTEAVGGGLVPRSGTFLGDHNRMQVSPRGSRIGLRLAAPEYEGIKVTGLVEGDFVGNQPTPLSEAAFFTNPGFRIRHAWGRLSFGGVDLTVGQTWYLFGWVPNAVGYSVMVAGLPGAIYGRTPQIRLSTAIKSDAVTVELAAAVLRPPQRDSGVPEGQAGVRVLVNNWKGMRTPGPAVAVVEPMSIGVSSVVRRFEVPQLLDQTKTTSATGYGIAADLLIPIVPPKSRDDRQFALTASAEAAYSQGCADLYTAFTGGAAFPTTVPGSMPAAPYTANLDNGFAGFNTANELQAVKWAAVTGGVQLYLTNQLFIAGNGSWVHSSNIDDVTPTARQTAVYKRNVFFDGVIAFEPTPVTRFGAEVGHFKQTYLDGTKADATRFQLGFWFFF